MADRRRHAGGGHEALAETAAGFTMYMLSKVPRPTDSVEYDGMRFEVLDVDHYRVDQLLVKRLGTRAGPSAAPADSLAGS